jgi:hypothetical protein
MVSTLSTALDFFRDFGLFDVLLPFLLVFTVVFAVLQKSNILGEDQNNLDAIVAFVVGLLFVAASKAVSIINEALPQVMILVVVGLGFLLMLGIFAKPGGTVFDDLGKNTRLVIQIVMAVAVVLIFLGVIKLDNGQSWLSYGWNYLIYFWDSAVIGSIVIFLVVIGVIFFVVKGGKSEERGGTNNS